VNRHQAFDRLDFDNKLMVNHDVHPIAAIEANVLVANGKGYLALIAYAALFHIEAQALFVSRLQKTWAEVSMNLDRKPDDAFAESTAMR
jgi:hypothetical protein